MKVYLAGFNVDTAVLKELEQTAGKREDLTPEVLSAAYARISRDPRPINEIRNEAKKEVERSRKSNETIIFKMGHHSVAEHAVFNFDILGVSRFAMEEAEKFRLCSYTEKSQRYITLDKDFVIPQEIKGTPLEGRFVKMVQLQNEAYFKLFEKLKDYVFKKHEKLAADPKKHNLLEGFAKEDARYITSLATESQVGVTVNARILELMLRRFASHPLAEVKKLGKSIYEQVNPIAPSIVIFREANDRDLKTYPELKETLKEFIKKTKKPASKKGIKEVELVEFPKEGDKLILAALLHTFDNLSYEQCKSIAARLNKEQSKKIFKTSWQNMQFYDSMLREFEYVNLTFNIILSAACFGQLKRHRMSTITTQAYDPNLGITIPESIKETGMEKYFKEIVDKTNEVYAAINKETPLAAPYILTNAHRRRVLMRLNLRELYHISRLREDAHAQWDIQNISHLMSKEVKRIMPLASSLLCGKDKYNETYQNIFGHLPKVVQASLPGARRIK
ncbi:MAG: FAD-dependent thymidylate synthase [Candidatus Omnitrophica bacterium]|jgi:thymidylate synthase ThyX|nr:FAD-dependent thymidylate synthase [Candidatus Omnitrophota bacterium]